MKLCFACETLWHRKQSFFQFQSRSLIQKNASKKLLFLSKNGDGLKNLFLGLRRSINNWMVIWQSLSSVSSHCLFADDHQGKFVCACECVCECACARVCVCMCVCMSVHAYVCVCDWEGERERETAIRFHDWPFSLQPDHQDEKGQENEMDQHIWLMESGNDKKFSFFLSFFPFFLFLSLSFSFFLHFICFLPKTHFSLQKEAQVENAVLLNLGLFYNENYTCVLAYYSAFVFPVSQSRIVFRFEIVVVNMIFFNPYLVYFFKSLPLVI